MVLCFGSVTEIALITHQCFATAPLCLHSSKTFSISHCAPFLSPSWVGWEWATGWEHTQLGQLIQTAQTDTECQQAIKQSSYYFYTRLALVLFSRLWVITIAPLVFCSIFSLFLYLLRCLTVSISTHKFFYSFLQFHTCLPWAGSCEGPGVEREVSEEESM